MHFKCDFANIPLQNDDNRLLLDAPNQLNYRSTIVDLGYRYQPPWQRPKNVSLTFMVCFVMKTKYDLKVAPRPRPPIVIHMCICAKYNFLLRRKHEEESFFFLSTSGDPVSAKGERLSMKSIDEWLIGTSVWPDWADFYYLGDFLNALAIIFGEEKPKIEQDFEQFLQWYHFLPLGPLWLKYGRNFDLTTRSHWLSRSETKMELNQV